MSLPKLPKSAVVLAAVLVALVAAAIGFEALVSAGTPGPTSGEYAVVIVRDGKELGAFTLEDLKDIGYVKETIDGDLQEGPRLLDVLAEAGVRDFETLTIAGMGIRDDGLITLTRDQVSERVLLDVAIRGTVKVVGPGIEWGDRVRDVTQIEVQ
jgi:hypothetical protein